MNRIFLLLLTLFSSLSAQLSPLNPRSEETFLPIHVEPFSEWMLSWSGQRPTEGSFVFYVRLFVDAWSPWMPYAEWGKGVQTSFSFSDPSTHVKVFQDAAEVLDGHKASAFQIKIESKEGASLHNLRALHVYTNGDKAGTAQPISYEGQPLELHLQGLSQMVLTHERNKDMCSPTSTTAVVRHLSNNQTIDPLVFASQVLDQGFNIYGNWVLNTAQAASLLTPHYNVFVERLQDFNSVIARLQNNTPVIVSVRGPLQGSATPYAQGHLLVITGYHPHARTVLCMDPAFPQDDLTHVSYDLDDFLTAWGRRGNVAYVFEDTSGAPVGK